MEGFVWERELYLYPDYFMEIRNGHTVTERQGTAPEYYIQTE
tara:strand:- start:970 stop:1095 length:126 start_codon:yes stop_codon:yes gene_type:complete